MNVLLPYPSFDHSVACLDRARLGAQRVECAQVLSTLRSLSGEREASHPAARAAVEMGWLDLPVVAAWRGHESALRVYLSLALAEWRARGYINAVPSPYDDDWQPSAMHPWYRNFSALDRVVVPPWLGDDAVHASHRSYLMRALPEHYAQYDWREPPDLPLAWSGAAT